MAWRVRLSRLFYSLKAQLILGMLLIHFLLIPLLFGGVIINVTDTYQAAFVNKVRSDASMLASLAGKDPSANFLESVFYEHYLGGEMVYARMTNTKGLPLVMISDETHSADFNEDFFFGEHNDDIYYISLNVLDESLGQVGVLHLGYDEQPTRQLIDQVSRRAIFFAMAYVGLTLLVAVLWSNRLYRPLSRLRLLSRQVTSGRYREPLVVNTRLHEVASLAQDLNHMRRELVRKTEFMKHLALHDTLTGLPNRGLLEDRLNQAISAAKRSKSSVSLLLIDLDSFKEINDTLGHAAGDDVLKQTGDRLSSILRASDTVSRLGGDEYALVLPSGATEYVGAVAQKIANTILQPFELSGQSFSVGLSMGIAQYPEHGLDFPTLLQHADIAMYYAKKRHMDFAFYSDELDFQDIDKLTLATELRRDIANHVLHAYYQPIIQLDNKRLIGYEALARWPHPERGLLLPDLFIPMADKLGLIEGLTLEIITQTLEEYTRFSGTNNDLYVSINMSARLLQDEKFPDLLMQLLEKFQVSPASITLEVTENEVMVDPTRALEMLNELKKHGIRLSLDDFGTGYSSFEYLKNLPVDEVKIDKSFVWEMTRNQKDADIVNAIIGLSHTLGMTVLAEGVQDEETLDALTAAGCDCAQGFLFSEPVPIEMLGKLVN